MPRLADLPELLAALRQENLYRDPRGSAALSEAVDFSSNDTLGLAQLGKRAPGVVTPSAPVPTAARTGTGTVSRETSLGSGASRLVFGSHPEHLEVEAWLSEWQKTEAALLFSSGYAANVGALSSLLGPGDVVLSDALNHASLIDGIRLSRAEVRVFPHLNLEEARRLGQRTPPPGPRGATWLVLESYYSMDGDSPDLKLARELADEHGWSLYLDEAHAVGLWGPEGQGLAAEHGVRADVTMLGFGKAVGSSGAAIVASEVVRDWLWNRARSFMFSTAPSPVATGQLQEQLIRTRRAHAERERVHNLARRFRRTLQAQGWVLGEDTHGPIVGLVVGSSEKAQELAAELRARGLRTLAIRPPTVPPGTSRLRLTLSARHHEEDVARLEQALGELFERGRSAERSAAGFEPGTAERSEPNTPRSPRPDRKTEPHPPRRLLVLGTGTGIGKTYVSESLLRQLSRTERALGLKPIESGLGVTPPGESDWERLGQAGVRAVPPFLGLLAPLSPHLAAREEGAELSVSALQSWMEDIERDTVPDWTVIETAGAAFSPVTPTEVNLDALGWFEPDRVVLVVPDRLGVLSDVEATLRAMHHKLLTNARESDDRSGDRPSAPRLRRAPRPTAVTPSATTNWMTGQFEVPVHCIILSQPAEPDSSTGRNQAELERVVLPRFVTPEGRPIRVHTLERNGSLGGLQLDVLLGSVQ